MGFIEKTASVAFVALLAFLAQVYFNEDYENILVRIRRAPTFGKSYGSYSSSRGCGGSNYVPSCPDAQQTVYAYSGPHAKTPFTAFSKNWGWYMGPLKSGTNQDRWFMVAGAGRNVVTDSRIVGLVEVTYHAPRLTIKITGREGCKAFGRTTISVGYTTPCTTSPGLFTCLQSSRSRCAIDPICSRGVCSSSAQTFEFTNIHGSNGRNDLYIIIHSVTTEEVCKCKPKVPVLTPPSGPPPSSSSSLSTSSSVGGDDDDIETVTVFVTRSFTETQWLTRLQTTTVPTTVTKHETSISTQRTTVVSVSATTSIVTRRCRCTSIRQGDNNVITCRCCITFANANTNQCAPGETCTVNNGCLFEDVSPVEVDEVTTTVSRTLSFTTTKSQTITNLITTTFTKDNTITKTNTVIETASVFPKRTATFFWADIVITLNAVACGTKFTYTPKTVTIAPTSTVVTVTDTVVDDFRFSATVPGITKTFVFTTHLPNGQKTSLDCTFTQPGQTTTVTDLLLVTRTQTNTQTVTTTRIDTTTETIQTTIVSVSTSIQPASTATVVTTATSTFTSIAIFETTTVLPPVTTVVSLIITTSVPVTQTLTISAPTTVTNEVTETTVTTTSLSVTLTTTVLSISTTLSVSTVPAVITSTQTTTIDGVLITQTVLNTIFTPQTSTIFLTTTLPGTTVVTTELTSQATVASTQTVVITEVGPTQTSQQIITTFVPTTVAVTSTLTISGPTVTNNVLTTRTQTQTVTGTATTFLPAITFTRTFTIATSVVVSTTVVSTLQPTVTKNEFTTITQQRTVTQTSTQTIDGVVVTNVETKTVPVVVTVTDVSTVVETTTLPQTTVTTTVVREGENGLETVVITVTKPAETVTQTLTMQTTVTNDRTVTVTQTITEGYYIYLPNTVNCTIVPTTIVMTATEPGVTPTPSINCTTTPGEKVEVPYIPSIRCIYLGQEQFFNVLVFGNFKSFSDIEGRLAVRGNAQLGDSKNGFSVGDRLQNVTCDQYTTVVKGQLTWYSGRNYFGQIVTSRESDSTLNKLVLDQVDESNKLYSCPLNYSTEVFDFDRAQSRLFNLSDYLVSLRENVAQVEYGTQNNGWSLTVTFKGIYNIEIISIPNAATLLTIKSIRLKNYKAGTLIIFNVGGVSGGFDGCDMEELADLPVIWNFYDATSLQFMYVRIRGWVLALKAQIGPASGVMDGSLFAKSFDSQGNQFQFNAASYPICPGGADDTVDFLIVSSANLTSGTGSVLSFDWFLFVFVLSQMLVFN